MNPKYIKSIARILPVIILVTLVASLWLPAYAAPGDLTRVSVDSSGAQANDWSRRSTISGDGRYVAFESDASNLVSGDTNGAGDIFVHDRQTGATTRVSVNSSGAEANGGSDSPTISNDGRYVAFYSSASNLVSGDTNGVGDIFVRDRQTSVTTRVSVNSSGNQANGESSDYELAISGEGRYVAFPSEATNLVSGDTNDAGDIFVHDRQTGQTRRVSIDSSGAQADGGSAEVDISEDGRYVAFSSGATNLIAGDTNGKKDIFVYDLQTGGITLVSVNTSGEQADGGGGSPAISGDGRYVVFLSDSGNLDPRADEYRGKELVYVHDRQIGQTTLASVSSEGVILTVGLFDQPTISRDGRYVAFSFYDKGDNNGIMHIWVRDLQTGQSIKVEGGNDSSAGSSLSADGKLVAFWSGSSNLVSGDTNGESDIFVKEVAYGPERNPTVASVTPECGFSTPVCTYPTPRSVSFIVIFSEPVTGVTADDFSLEMLEGITGASITGVSGYGTEYFVTVATGTGDGRLRLKVVDNDSIKDTSLNPLGGIGMDNGNFNGKLYRIDKSNPTVTSIVRTDSSPTAAAEVRFTVTFSEGVYPVKPGVFVLSTTGSISGASVTAISPREDEYKTEATYTVTVNTGTGDGTLRLDLVDDDSILDIISNPLGGAGAGNGNFTTGGETYTIAKSPLSVPIVTGILRNGPNPTTANSVKFVVTFSEAVSGVDASDFRITTTGSLSHTFITGLSGSADTYTITIGTGIGNGTIRLDLADDDSIMDASGNPLGGVGGGNGNFTTGGVYTINKFVIKITSKTFRSNGTNDGWILESSENSNKGGSKNSNAVTFNLGDDAKDRQFRAILHFPTSYLPDNAVITQAILMIKGRGIVGTNPFTTHQNISIDIRKSVFGVTALEISDFQAPASRNSVGTIQNNPVGGWYWVLLNRTAYPYINLTGVTQFRLGFRIDDNDDRGDDYLKFYSGNAISQTDRPQLLIEYYVR
jgi:Tol biopolymer transport system component